MCSARASQIPTPKRIGPYATVAAGPGWSLTAWVSNRGICTYNWSISGGGGSSCGADVVGAPPDLVGKTPTTRPVEIACDVDDDNTFSHPSTPSINIDCVGAAAVDRIRVLFRDRTPLTASRLLAPPALKTNIHFFLLRSIRTSAPMTAFKSGHILLPFRSIIAYDANGRMIGRESGTLKG